MASVRIGKRIWFLCLKNAELTKLVAINIEYKYVWIGKIMRRPLKIKIVYSKTIFRNSLNVHVYMQQALNRIQNPRWKAMHFFLLH